MPNWVKTRLKLRDITDERFVSIIEKFTKRDSYSETQRVLDFEKIIPMPKDVFRGNLGSEERAKYGEKNWYDWSCKNWGTKWPASDGYDDQELRIIEFQTAWSFAEPVVRMFAVKVGCDIEALYADEDLGRNCGRVVFTKDGDIDEYAVKPDSPEAWEIVEELWGVTKDEYDMDE